MPLLRLRTDTSRVTPPFVLAWICCAFVALASCRSEKPAPPAEKPPVARTAPASQLPAQGQLAIIVDDLGYDRAAASELLALDARLTFAVLPHTPLSFAIAQEAHRRGREVMLHLPMQSANGEAKREAIELTVGMNANDVRRTVGEMLATVPHARGVNNHQGSFATADAELMMALMTVLGEQRLYFLDSRTGPGTRAYAAARSARVPAATRDVFLDDEQTREATLRQLALAVVEAKKNGRAIAIGHPYPTTLAALREFLPQLPAHGIRLVFVSELVQ